MLRICQLCSARANRELRAGWQARARQFSDVGVERGLPGPKKLDTGNTPLGKGFDLLADEGSASKVTINGYDPEGFVVGAVRPRGSILAFPRGYVLWRPTRVEDITVESLKIVGLLKPKVELLLIGVGERNARRLPPDVMAHFKRLGIPVEQMDTVNACSTFNVLNTEDRVVCAAVLSQRPYLGQGAAEALVEEG